MSETELIQYLLITATLLPLVTSFLLLFIGKRFLGSGSAWLAVAVMAVSFACTVVSLITWLGMADHTPIVLPIPWIPLPGNAAGWLYLGLLADGLTMVLMVMVSGISMLVHLYSVGYMHGDPKFERFFAYLLLFTFSMMGIVTANGLMQLFVCWELVGLTSYLLIGFWYEKRSPQLACNKAFIMNRVGDMGFLIGFGILFYQLGGKVLLPATAEQGNMFAAIADQIVAQGYSLEHPPMWLTVAGIGLFFGAIGKSAQFPLHTWLPDAMEGPTPVSSIVHSATMVAAGVYLTARIYPILTPEAHLFVASIGLITLVMAACMALVMTDIKKVLAYSTLSQLGYMILGLGTGAYSFALFHLITHAFFKCCLFQCAGSVIHAAHHEQDMRQYGGLWKRMPITGTCYLICTLAIAGASIPYTAIGISGFYSKDGIIAGAVNYGRALAPEALGPWASLFYLGPAIIAYVTVFYMARSFTLTFLGKPRNQKLNDHAEEVPWTMFVPQICLSAMAILSAPIIMSFWLNGIISSEPTQGVRMVQAASALEHGHGMHATHTMLLSGLAWIITLIVGIAFYLPGMSLSSKVVKIPVIRQLYIWTLNKFYFDTLYDLFLVQFTRFVAYLASRVDKYVIDGQPDTGIMVGFVNGSALLIKRLAFATGGFDRGVVDGAVNGAADAARGGGAMLRASQPGRVRAYVLGLFCAAALLLLLVLTVVAVNQ